MTPFKKNYQSLQMKTFKYKKNSSMSAESPMKIFLKSKTEYHSVESDSARGFAGLKSAFAGLTLPFYVT